MTNPKESSQSFSIFETKEDLYSLFYELLSEVKGQKIELDEEEYEENVRSTPINQITKYIRETIRMLLKKYSKEQQSNHIEVTKNDISQYESLLRAREQNERKFIKNIFQYKLHREALESRIEDYMEMEEDYEEMKTKLKYEDGKFLDNDRKDNEILIIRSENTNLKKIIADNEKNIKNLNMILQEKENVLNKLNEKISLLSKKLEETEKELNLFSNINININNSNNASNSSGYVSSPLQHQQHNNHSSSKCCFNVVNGGLTDFKNTSSQIKLLNFKKLKPSMKHSNEPGSSTSHIQSSTMSQKTSKNSHQRNNSMNTILDKKKIDLISKYFSNKHNHHKSFNNNYKKIIQIPLNLSQMSNRNNTSGFRYLTNRESSKNTNSCKHTDNHKKVIKEQEYNKTHHIKQAILKNCYASMKANN